MLKMIVSGTLGQDAEIREVGNKKAINFDVAVSMDYKDQQGNKVERTEWVRAVIWKNEGQSTKVADYLKKGRKVLLEGIPSSEGFKTKDGEIKSALNINVKELEFLS
ncbi:single-stranded DNA-binding protein [Thermophagus xiamenensis]|jgi:single-strand DNA-binding protein|uniref:Single-stranded DNA-binding protein n=1 Tax=Thermophagus xiamenensis TaxID=385682 RepID=A0A1I1UF18_9BACT|nr:single-stranded DNA-binding protein [Thermophagus xiamenensis]SFD69284.1 single-strand DNA-binding protein [Thermophagus xiamenensis]